MPYNPTDWKDHVVQFPNRYRETTDEQGYVTHEEAPGEVIQQGTPMSATNFNKQEHGIAEALSMADILFSEMLLKLGHSEYSLDTLVSALKSGDLVAAKAVALETARTIALSGGATGTATEFDGSGNVTIPVTALDPTKLSAAVSIEKGGTGAATAEAARTKLSVPSITDLQAAIILADAQHSISQANERDHDDRLRVAEAQLAALAG